MRHAFVPSPTSLMSSSLDRSVYCGLSSFVLFLRGKPSSGFLWLRADTCGGHITDSLLVVVSLSVRAFPLMIGARNVDVETSLRR